MKEYNKILAPQGNPHEKFIHRTTQRKSEKGHRIFLFDPIKPTTVEEIEQNKEKI
jgi:hypothetical protein